jgi:hypothetical protein
LWCDQQYTVPSHVMVIEPNSKWCDETSNGVIKQMC